MNIINYLWRLKKRFFFDILRQSPGISCISLIKLSSRKFSLNGAFKVAWILCGDIRVGSSRIHGINIHNYLLRNGCDSNIFFKPKEYDNAIVLNNFTERRLLNSNVDIVMFQRVHKGDAEKLAAGLKERGKKTVYLMADYYESRMPLLCDYVIAVSKYLRGLLITHGTDPDKIIVIPDAIETPPELHKQYYDSKGPIKIVWVGAQGHWDTLRVVKKALSDPALIDTMELITISNHPESTYQWNLNTVWDNILRCDIAVLPIDLSDPANLVKSNNRLTMFKALGIPVICSPLPLYGSIIKDGQNGFLARDVEDWTRALIKLKDAEIRQRIGTTGREEIFSEFGIDTIGKKFLDFFYTIAR
jgi:glycosyltransferase involved in cell wall biosynthesis